MAVSFEDELAHVGNNNRFQVVAFIMMAFGYAIPASQTMSNVFISPERSFECLTGGNASNLSRNNITDDTQCVYKDYMEQERKCTSWKFSTHIYKSTIQSHYGLVCHQRYVVQLCQSIFMVGCLAGTLIYGNMSDRIGRLRTIQLSWINILVAGIVTPLMPTWPLYITGRFITGLSTGGFVVPPVYMTEVVGHRHRMTYLTMLAVFYYVGYVFAAAVAYFFRFHEYLEMAIGVAIVPAILGSFWLPESPRWLLSKKRDCDTYKALKRIATFNRRSAQFMQTCVENVNKSAESTDRRPRTRSIILLLKHSGIRRVTIFLSVCLFSTALAYFGLLFTSDQYTDDLFTYLAISSVVEGIAVALGGRLSAWLGRIPLLMLSSLIFALILVACGLCTILETNPTVLSVMALVGRIIADMLFCGLISYSPEVFPTSVRNTGVGVVILFSRLGGILAPEAGLFSLVWAPLPLLIYTLWALLAVISVLFLPETKNTFGIETIGDAERLYKRCIVKDIWAKLTSGRGESPVLLAL